MRGAGDARGSVAEPRSTAPLTDPEAVDLLHSVVGTPSLSGEERAVAELLVAAAGAGGAHEAWIDEVGNAVARWGAGPLRVTFLGHMDTVPGDIPVRLEDGVLHGRGTVDAKGSLCAALVAATRLGPGAWERLTFTFIGAVEEEAASSAGAHHALAAYPRPDLLIVGEPSGWERYTLGYKGRLGVTVRATLPAAHTAREDPSAAEAVIDAFSSLREHVRRVNAGTQAQFERLQLTLLGIESGGDGLEAWCTARARLRLPPGCEGEELARTLSALPLPDGVALAFTDVVNAHRASSRTALARAFRVAIRAAGGNPTPTLKSGTSDMNVVAREWDVPMLAYGPGDSNLDHAPDERLPVRDYLAAVEVLGRALEELARLDG